MAGGCPFEHPMLGYLPQLFKNSRKAYSRKTEIDLSLSFSVGNGAINEIHEMEWITEAIAPISNFIIRTCLYGK
jgi:hypothetical protein